MFAMIGMTRLAGACRRDRAGPRLLFGRTRLSPLGNAVLAWRQNVRHRYQRQAKKQWKNRVPMRGKQPGQDEKDNARRRASVRERDAPP
jgi:hypothetical protein